MVGALSFATQVGWHFMYKGAVMPWQNTSKTCRGGGKHDCIFWPEEAYAIKKVMTSFAETFKTTLHTISCRQGSQADCRWIL